MLNVTIVKTVDFEKLSGSIQEAHRLALQDTIRHMKTAVVRQVSADTGIQQKKIRDSKRVKMGVYLSANWGEVSLVGRYIPAAYAPFAVDRFASNKDYVSVRMFGGWQYLPGAFRMTSKSGHVGIYRSGSKSGGPTYRPSGTDGQKRWLPVSQVILQLSQLMDVAAAERELRVHAAKTFNDKFTARLNSIVKRATGGKTEQLIA